VATSYTRRGSQSTRNPDACEQDGYGRVLVVACSALKKSYRDVLRGVDNSILTNSQEPGAITVDENVLPSEPHPHKAFHPSLPTFFVHLTGSHDTLYERMANRKGHYMKSNMLDSQTRTMASLAGTTRLRSVAVCWIYWEVILPRPREGNWPYTSGVSV
jgi:gluconokinase